MKPPDRRPIADVLADYDRLLEVGIGRRPDVAARLADEGRDVIAIDVDLAAVATDDLPAEVSVHEVDVLDLATRAERAAIDLDDRFRVDAVYALNLPAELQRPTHRFAAAIDAACLFTTLGFEEPTVPVDRRAAAGETLYVSRAENG